MTRARLHTQRGVAVITALLLTTLAITIVASLFWQQQVQVRSMENQRLQLQTKWILRGALDWARLILREDGRFSGVDHMGEPWAVKLAETRLDDYIERDRNDGDATDAALSGNITDAQARYNLRNLTKADGSLDPFHVKAYQRLLTTLELPPELAAVTAQAIARDRPAGAPPPAEGGQPVATEGMPLGLMQVDDLLSLPGYTPEIVNKLRDYVVLLPPNERAPVNVNTASAEVIAAVIPSMSVGDARSFVLSRDRAFIQNDADFTTRRNNRELDRTDAVALKTSFFFVYGRVRLDRASLQTLALMQRDNNGARVVWIREN
ncbi:MAG TPA: type II secretion system minor pseudopilin GspK [Burkholderiaceae bacterium]